MTDSDRRINDAGHSVVSWLATTVFACACSIALAFSAGQGF